MDTCRKEGREHTCEKEEMKREREDQTDMKQAKGREERRGGGGEGRTFDLVSTSDAILLYVLTSDSLSFSLSLSLSLSRGVTRKK